MKTNANQDQDDSLESSSSVASIGLSIAPSEIDSPASPSSSSSSSFRKLITNFKRINDDDASSVIDDDEDEDNNDDDDDDDDDDDNNIELRNYICLHLICSVHKTIFLCKNSKGVWSWPSKHFVSDLQPKSLRKHLREHLKELSSLSLLKGPLERYRADLLQIYRVRMIRYNQFCQRFLFKIILYQIEEKNQCFCLLNDPNDRANPNSSIDFIQSLSIRFKWFRLDEIRTKFIDEIWPGEIFVDSFDIDTEQSIKNFIELDTNRLREDITQRFRSDQIESAIEFFNEYILLCYPSSSMTWSSFDMFCNKTNWFIEHDHRKQLFQSIDTKRKGSIDFLELLNGFILFNENRLQKNLKPSSFFEIFMKNSHNSRCSISRMENYSKILKQFHHKSNERCLKCLFRRSDETDHGVLRKKFHLSSVLIKLKESGSIRRLYQLRSNPQCSNGSIEFRDEIPKRNIFLLTNQMMKFLESIKSKHQSSDGHWSIFLQNNSIYCCLLLILEFANKLLANTESIVQIDSPGFIIGSMDACFKELVKLCKTLLPTFSFAISSFILFLGDLIEIDNPICFIYVICMKILRPNNVVLLLGKREKSFLEEPKAQRSLSSSSSSSVNLDRIDELMGEIIKSLPIACIVDDQVFVSNFAIYNHCESLIRLKQFSRWLSKRSSKNNIDGIYYERTLLNEIDEPSSSFINKNMILFGEDFFERISIIINPINDQNELKNLKKFLSKNNLFVWIDSYYHHRNPSKDSKQLDDSIAKINNQIDTDRSDRNNIENSRNGSEQNNDDLDDETSFQIGYEISNDLNRISIVSSRNLSNLPTIIFLDRDCLRCICLE